MATYNVGNIEVGAVGNMTNALQSLDKIINKLDQVKASLGKSDTSTNKITKSFNQLNDSVNKVGKSTSSLFNLGKIYFLINYSKRVIGSIVKIVSVASDYTEILNKFQVSFGDLYEQSIDYVNRLSKAYGMSKNTLMEYSSTFNNMLKSLKGLTDETSQRLSFTLTQLALDYSSLFNQSIESTMLAFQSMLSGQIRPIRSVSGIDTSEASIFAIYKELGGTKTMRQLNQLEKRLLKIIALEQQMMRAGAIGDFARTIETFSNQIRIMKEEMTEFSSTWGQLLLVYIKPVIRYINGLLLAINAIGQAIKKNNEIENEIDYDKEFAGLEKGAFKAENQVDELSKSLGKLALDQLNVMGDSAGTNNFDIGVDEKILNAVNEYKSNLDSVSFKAQEISDNILKWLGFTKDETGEINNLDNALDSLKKKFISIGSAFVGIEILLNLPKIISGVKGIFSSLKLVGSFLSTGILSPVGLIIGAIALIAAGIISIFNSGDERSKQWKAELKNTWDNILKPALKNMLSMVKDLFDILKVIFKKVIVPISAAVGDLLFNVIIPLASEIFYFTTEILKIVMAIIKPIVEILAPILEFILDIIGKIVKGISIVLNVAIKMIGGLLAGFGQLINLLIDGINWIIRGLNKISVNVPDWMGGGTWGFNIKELSRLEIAIPTLPEFANGNVATTPTLAKFGEYANARYNPEITAPQSILKETFIESMLPFVNAILKGDDEVIKAIKEQNLTLNINGREFAEATMNDFKSVATRKGYKI